MAKITKSETQVSVKDKTISVEIPEIKLEGDENPSEVFSLMVKLALQARVQGDTDVERVVGLFNNAIDQRVRLRARNRHLQNVDVEPQRIVGRARRALDSAFEALRAQGYSEREIRQMLDGRK